MGQAAMIAPIARQGKLCASCPAGPKRQLPAVSGSPGKRRPYRRDGIGGLAAVRPAALRHVGASTTALAAPRLDTGAHQIDRAETRGEEIGRAARRETEWKSG